MKIVFRIKVYQTRHASEYLPPWYYGYVDYDPWARASLFAIIPLNWLLRVGRYLRYWWDRLRGGRPKYVLIDYDRILLSRHSLTASVEEEVRKQIAAPDFPTKLRQAIRRVFSD
jgi:hypothetical protein